MGIPTIQMLTSFARKYIPNVTVKWETMKGDGLAEVEKKTISLSRNISLDSQSCLISNFGTITYEKDLKLKPGEQYFLCLLHEIGHFKTHLKIPKYYERIKQRVEKVHPNKESQMFLADDLLNQRKDEDDEEFNERLIDLKTYILSGASGRIKEHMAVYKWARREFLKKRKTINKLL